MTQLPNSRKNANLLITFNHTERIPIFKAASTGRFKSYRVKMSSSTLAFSIANILDRNTPVEQEKQENPIESNTEQDEDNPNVNISQAFTKYQSLENTISGSALLGLPSHSFLRNARCFIQASQVFQDCPPPLCSSSQFVQRGCRIVPLLHGQIMADGFRSFICLIKFDLVA